MNILVYIYAPTKKNNMFRHRLKAECEKCPVVNIMKQIKLTQSEHKAFKKVEHWSKFKINPEKKTKFEYCLN